MTTSLSCQVRIKEAKNITSNLRGGLFVRLRLPRHRTGSLNTRQIPSRNDPVWDETFSLECHGSDITPSDALSFELRRRSSVPFAGSKLLGTAEIPFEWILRSSSLSVDTWLALSPTCGGAGEAGVKLKVENSATCREERKRREYGCEQAYGSACEDYNDVFALQLVC